MKQFNLLELSDRYMTEAKVSLINLSRTPLAETCRASTVQHKPFSHEKTNKHKRNVSSFKIAILQLL
jgi:hypothetical protein